MVSRRKPRQYPRTARLNQLLREILAEELDHIGDERLELLAITSVDVDSDLHRALVYFDSLDGPEGDEEVLDALDDARKRLRQAIGSQARIKRVPELVFLPDPAVREGGRIEAILAELGPLADDIPVPDEMERPLVQGASDPPSDSSHGIGSDSESVAPDQRNQG